MKEVLDEKLNLVEETLCKYLKSYEISVKKYKDPIKMLNTKYKTIKNNIVAELKSLNGIKWQIALKIDFIKDNKNISGTFYSNQNATTNSQSINDDYKKSISKINEAIEKFTQRGSGWTIHRCDTLFILTLRNMNH